MSRIAAVFERLRQEQRTGLIPYVTAGDPRADMTIPVLHALVEAGADILELGIPFSDPMADGPVIQKACDRALANGVDLGRVLAMVSEFRNTDQTTPIVLMGYMNPIERFGVEAFARRAHDAGVDGALIVDCPPEEAGPLRTRLAASAMDEIFLVAPTTTPSRCDLIAAQASGFVYYVSLKGVTGAGLADHSALAAPVAELRQHTQLPVAVGFGIKDAAGACTVAETADAVVIGSALVECLSAVTSPQEAQQRARDFLGPIRRALDDGTSSNCAVAG